MSEKTIEICSIHSGEILVPIPGEEARTINFEPRRDEAKQRTIGVALCDDKEAEILLGRIGHPQYFKAQNEFENLASGSQKEPGALSEDAYSKLNVKAVATLVKTINSIDEIKQLIVTETAGQNRAGALKSLEDRLGELEAAGKEEVALTADNFSALEGEKLIAAINSCNDSDLLKELLATTTQSQNPAAETVAALDARLEELTAQG